MKPGVKASIDAAGGAAAVREAAEVRQAAEGEQLALLAEENDRLDELLPLAPPPARRGPGRPPGARNKRTQQLASYYLGRYGDPLEALLAMGTGDLTHTHRALADAARATGLPLHGGGEKGKVMTVMDLLVFKQRCLETVLPYLHARLAPTDDKGDPVVPILALGTVRPGAAEAVAKGGALSIEDLIDVTPVGGDESEPDQALSEGEP
ncbi:hypothetical protein AOPFMNJM_1678 [Methylobacterium jeotgali]|uniref:Uncharacterized protein n=7 Tax=Pseudomonadota TaxID=1224 RepID=A0ABQ4ST12_9HYPH|nr:hypothetical protein AOPFMNJM_1678 [Methylobacterium jeotgali]